ncbi:hypothetical protein HETIRDRAFT_173713 [Heterobasidion irregulare TC 32-1]|uniref:Uncharacterized protein n=1 Tax=Heterobasidion irregulare (strain TC 32-1) TaxID=747525 RepID=W4JXL2_HETIT|nr:uncharacterized protein HETIRDRAFT_173713 [Heterobasidion irregulare TC 32-1]ETW77636.1 hypothetical protein HETIRDRAFT_173713 [Heterobasidion irregulare TC 32-1]
MQRALFGPSRGRMGVIKRGRSREMKARRAPVFCIRRWILNNIFTITMLRLRIMGCSSTILSAACVLTLPYARTSASELSSAIAYIRSICRSHWPHSGPLAWILSWFFASSSIRCP